MKADGQKDKCGKTHGKKELKGGGEEMEGQTEPGDGGVLQEIQLTLAGAFMRCDDQSNPANQ